MSDNTGRFTDRATSYVAGRPSYPPAAIDALLDGLGAPPTLRVADLGAGTGISSRCIAERGPYVFAIEPNAAMRDAAVPAPRIEWVDGTAENTTLAAASVDLVTAFQAWHWVDHDAAIAEARRILRPHGRLAVVYNERDERDAFTARYGEIVRRYARDATEQRRADALERFANIDPEHTRRFEFVNVHDLDRFGMHARAASSSYLPQNGSEAEAMNRDIDLAIDDAGNEANVRMHLVTIVMWTIA